MRNMREGEKRGEEEEKKGETVKVIKEMKRKSKRKEII